MALIFVCGGQHSGTALIAELIGRHPEVLALGHETRVLLDEPSDTAVTTLVAGWQEEALGRGKRWLCEPTARHIQVLDRLYRLFPDAAIVVPIRDPRAVASDHKRAGKPITRAARRWCKDNAAACQAAADGLPIVPFRFEDLVEDPGAVLAWLTDAIGLPPAQPMIDAFDLPANEDRGDELTAEEAAAVEGACGSLMEQLGYAPARAADVLAVDSAGSVA